MIVDTTSPAFKAYIYAPALGLLHSLKGLALSPPKLVWKSTQARITLSYLVMFNIALTWAVHFLVFLVAPWLLDAVISLAVGVDWTLSHINVILNVARRVTSWIDVVYHTAAALYGVLWYLPIILSSKIFSVFSCQELANETDKVFDVKSKSRFTKNPSVADLATDAIYSFLVFISLLLQSWVIQSVSSLHFLPSVVWALLTLLVLANNSLMYAMYAFEYKWITQGIVLAQRMRVISTNWTYFLAFGLPMGVLSTFECSVPVPQSLVFALYVVAASTTTMPKAADVAPPRYIPWFTPATFLSDQCIMFYIRRQSHIAKLRK